MTNRRIFIHQKQAGLAISTILLAVVLLAAIAVTLAISVRSGNASSSAQTDKTLATTIIDQGNVYARGIQQLSDDPSTTSSVPCYVALWNHNSGPYYGLYNPANPSAIPQQYPPAAALVDTTQQWAKGWTVCYGYVYEPGVGTPASNRADYGMILADIKQGVCRQINQVLYCNTTLTVSTETLSTWESNSTQAVLHPNNSNQPMACFQTLDGHYIYYVLVGNWPS